VQVAVPERGARVGEQLLEANGVDPSVSERVPVGKPAIAVSPSVARRRAT
jgi:hypothetical protein